VKRASVPLDGEWEIADSVAAQPVPASFNRKVPVPGLANLARPTFPDIDLFDSRELIMNRIRRGELPHDFAVPANQGIPKHERNYLWYRRTFDAPAQRERALLEIKKAQFGVAVWLNGVAIGEHLGCFTAGWFDLTGPVKWGAANELLVRVGAHPATLPQTEMSGTDYEKLKWTPGIYDSVAVHFMDNPVIESVQVAPRIGDSSILVEATLRNYGPAAAAATLAHEVVEWNGGRRVAETRSERIQLAAGETRKVRHTIRVPGARLWSPEEPFLYQLRTSSGGDTLHTRFGMREFRFDTVTRRAYLNGKPYFLRGSNITLHRFFEDPECKHLPWDEAWVRKLLGEIPKRMHWNTFRFCIGPVPDFWFDVADETGLLIQNEYFIWTGNVGGSCWRREWDMDLLTGHFREWLRDHWNHPSNVIWDASNETYAPELAEKVISAVRGLDLSNRPWENGYNLPHGPDDPYEDHPYLFTRVRDDPKRPFQIEELEYMSAMGRDNAARPSAHAAILNEYDWLWLNRDGTPTKLTENVYQALDGGTGTPAERLALNAYLLAGLTEFWRAHRNYAGILHLGYLTCSYPGVYTSDHWKDVAKLTLHPDFEDYVGESFKPLGVYLNFFQKSVKPGLARRYAISVVNDHGQAVAGKLALSFENAAGQTAVRREAEFEVPAGGQQSYEIELEAPAHAGEYLLKAAALPAGGPVQTPTVSRRRVRLE
jgi:hypothetical protein